MIRRPATILALLTGLNLLNYLDRLLLSAVLPKVQDALALSGFAAGALSTVFLIGYFATSPIFGWLADRGTRKRLISVGVLIWSAATFASGLAHTPLQLFLARAMVGVGEASYAALAPTIIDDLAPPERKGRWLAVFYVAAPVGSALGYLVGGFVEQRYGWRAAFFVAGGPGVLLALLTMLIVEPARKPVENRPPLREAVRAVTSSALYRRGVLGYCAYAFGVGGFAFWAPTFLYRRYALPLDVANFRFGVVTVVAGVIGTAIGGVWGDRNTQRRLSSQPHPGDEGRDRAIVLGNLRVCAVGSWLAAPLAVGCFLSPSPTVFFALGFVCELALFLNSSPINAVVLRSVPPMWRASAMALCIFAIHLFGDLWSPPLIGLLADFGSVQRAMMMVPAAIAVSAVIWTRAQRTP